MKINIFLKIGEAILFRCDTKKEGFSYINQINEALSLNRKSIVLHRNNYVEKIEIEIENIESFEIVIEPGENIFNNKGE